MNWMNEQDQHDTCTGDASAIPGGLGGVRRKRRDTARQSNDKGHNEEDIEDEYSPIRNRAKIDNPPSYSRQLNQRENSRQVISASFILGDDFIACNAHSIQSLQCRVPGAEL
jgi:hypothetical protein